MNFVARHISFGEVDGAWVLALGDEPGGTREAQPQHYAIVQFGPEDEQDVRLGLTGLHLETSGGVTPGYGLVERIEYRLGTITIVPAWKGSSVVATLATDMMTSEAISDAVARCNHANASRQDPTR